MLVVNPIVRDVCGVGNAHNRATYHTPSHFVHIKGCKPNIQVKAALAPPNSRRFWVQFAICKEIHVTARLSCGE
jgi:hypothetical protein